MVIQKSPQSPYTDLLLGALSTLPADADLPSTLKSLLRNITKLLGCSGSSVYYIVENSFFYVDPSSSAIKLTSIPDEQVKKVFETREALEFAEDATEGKNASAEHAELVTWLHPLIINQHIIGVLKIEHLRAAGRDTSGQFAVFLNYFALVLDSKIRSHISTRSDYSRLKNVNAALNQEIDVRVQTEKSLRRNQLLLCEAQHIARIGSWEYDLENKACHWSDELYAILGYSAGAIEPSFDVLYEHIHPEDQETFLSMHTLLDPVVSPRQNDFRIITGDGRVRNIFLWFTVEQDAEGTYTRILGALQDITDRVSMEDELRRSRDGLEVKVAERTAALKIANQRLENELAERTRAELALRESETEIKTLLKKSERAQKVLLSILEDVKLAEQARQESEELFSSVLETASDAIIAVNGSGAIVLWNREAEKMFGYTKQAALGMNFFLLLPKAVRERHLGSFKESLKTGRATGKENVLRGPAIKQDGTEFMVEAAFGLVRKADDMLVTVIYRDITERLRIEQEAMRSSQLASIGELAAGVAHEINNPIMGVINYAQIILNRSAAAGGDSELPQRIISEAERVAKIVANLLGFAREATETPAPAELRPVVEAAIALMRKTVLQSGVAVTVTMEPEVPRAIMQPQKIQQVFINILSNALYALNQKFPGAHIDKGIEITAETLPAGDGAFVRIEFLDNGCGIPEAIMHKICNPFFTTKPVGTGTGLGLSISYNILKEHGGRLLFESRPGAYTRVMVDLPRE